MIVYKFWFYGVIALILATFIGVGVYNYKTKKELREKLEIAEMNNRALVQTNLIYNGNIEDLRHSNMKADRLVDSLIKVSKIKPKRVIQTIYVSDSIIKRDSVLFHDTIFKQPGFKIDTVIGDKYIKNKLNLEYPNKITIKNEIFNEKVIIFEEYKAPLYPSRWWLFRLFQKKYTWVRVHIKNTNPYIKENENKTILYRVK